MSDSHPDYGSPACVLAVRTMGIDIMTGLGSRCDWGRRAEGAEEIRQRSGGEGEFRKR